jgi:succinoglycan biosynthesis protein ExoI
LVALAVIGFAVDKPTLSAGRVVTGTSFVEPTIVGRASVVDGDTITIRDEHIRFHGIDAPESDQLCQGGKGQSYRCGSVSANALDRFQIAAGPLRLCRA